jgi:hypothetical protein
MAVTAASVASDIQVVQGFSDAILQTISGLDPGVALPAEATEAILATAAQLVTAALTAFSNASGTPINATTIAALMPNPEPLPLPTDLG